jgi:hypothetical protein
MTRKKGLILVCPTWAEGVRILRLLVRKEVPMLDTSDPKGWSHPDKIGKDHDCPLVRLPRWRPRHRVRRASDGPPVPGMRIYVAH